MLLYIHIPFCDSKCPYCAFGSLVGQNDKFKPYFDALLRDFNHFTQDKSIKFDTVFIGGGTPSVALAHLYEPLFAAFSPFLAQNAEITTEANPNSASYEWLSQMKALGVNRLSLGAQSFNEKKLKLLGRTHDVKAVSKALNSAARANINRASVDVIYGTALDDESLIKAEVSAIKELGVAHASAYSLTLEEGTPFYKKYEMANDDEDLARLMFSELQSIGLKRYEVSNFGEICAHNLGYWQGKEYLGIGAFSVGFMNKTRLYAAKNLNEYLASPTKRQAEILSDDDLLLERIFLGLRSCVGIKLSELPNSYKKRVKTLLLEGKLTQEKDKIYAYDYLLADELALYITS